MSQDDRGEEPEPGLESPRSDAPGSEAPRAQSGAVSASGPAARTGEPPRTGFAAVWANPGYRFVLLFLPYLGIAAFLYPRFAKEYRGFVESMIVGTARLLHWVFQLFTDRVSNSERLLIYDGFPVTIVDECTGIYEVIIFTAAVLAFPTTWRKKVIGVVLGNLVIYVFNILRIAMLILVGRYFPAIFEFMHLYFWQATMILMIASVWLLWIVKVVRREGPTASAAA